MIGATSGNVLNLDQVTLIAATSVNVDATIQAMEACRRNIRFAACKLLTHGTPRDVPSGIDVAIIPEMKTSRQYSDLMLCNLADHVDTAHCLVVQWDGHVVNPQLWNDSFLEYDYIGASWPQFGDGHDVGNGGFSLRSRRLLEACRSPAFTPSHPEDVAIGRLNRTWLEAQGLRFAPRNLADAFSAERASSLDKAFGFHGAWHMPQVLGADRFWTMYQELENRTSVYHDASLIMSHLIKDRCGLSRCMKLVWDKFQHTLSGSRNFP